MIRHRYSTLNKNVVELSSKVSGNYLQKCRGTVSKKHVRELSCRGTVSISLYTKRDPGPTEYLKVLHYLNVQQKYLGLSRTARVRRADRDLTTN